MRSASLALVTVIVIGLAVPALAQTARATGTVKDTAGKDVTVKVTKSTKVKASPAMKVQDLKAGTRVVITAQEGKDKSMTASLIEVGVAAAKK